MKDLPEGATIEGLRSENVSDATKKKVFVKAQEGTYEFTISTTKGSVKVTVNVVDVTMPKFKMFKSLRAEEIVAISDEAIKYNSEEVKFGETTTTFKGNVNLMKASTDGAKYYKVRIETEKYDNTKVVAVNQNTLKEYKTEPVAGAANEIYVYLDANEAEIPLVLKHKDATEKQVKDAVATTVKFNTTSTIWVNKAEAGRSYYKYNGTTINAKVNSVNQQVINIGVDFDKLPKATFKVVDGKVTEWKEDSSKGEKWIALSLQLTKEADVGKARTITNAVHTDSTNIILDKTEADPTWRWVWIRAEGEGTVKFTLKYTLADNKVEELPITVNLHDIKEPLVTSVTSTTAGINNVKVDATGLAITVDSYKYGMDATVERKESKDSAVATKGRWYSLQLKTNVDVSSLVYEDEDGNWAEIPEDMISNGKIVVWLNADEAITKPVIKLANRYTVTVGEATSSDGVSINVTRTEKSKVELNNTVYAVSKAKVNDQKSLNELYLRDVTVVESNLKNAKEDASGNQAGTLKYNLAASTTATINTPLAKNANDIRTTTLRINSNKVSTIKVNGVEGKWIVVHMTVKGNIDTLVDETNDDSSIIIDPSNIQLLTQVDNNGEVRVPIWINLSSPAIKAVTSTPSKAVSGTIDVKFGSTGPVVEHNSFKLKVIDNNPMEEELVVKEPKAVDTSVAMKNGEPDDTTAGTFMSGGAGNVTAPSAAGLIENMKKMSEATITSDVVDDTVYVKVKTNLTEFNDVGKLGANDVIITPIAVDVSALGSKKGENLYVWGAGQKRWGAPEAQSTATEFYLNVAFTQDSTSSGSDYSDLKAGKTVTKEFIITNSVQTQSAPDRDTALGQLAGKKYIRYVITFENV